MLLFATHLPSYAGWWAGLITGCALVAVAVAVVMAIIAYAARISRQAGAAIFALERARRETADFQRLAAMASSSQRLAEAVEAAGRSDGPGAGA